MIVSRKPVPVMVSFPALPMILLPRLAPPQAMVSFPLVPVTVDAVCVTPALTTQLTAAWGGGDPHGHHHTASESASEDPASDPMVVALEHDLPLL